MTTTNAAGLSLAGEVRALRDRLHLIDGLDRFAAGQDLRDPDLFFAAFTPDARVDFTQPTRRFGADAWEPSALFGAAAGALS